MTTIYTFERTELRVMQALCEGDNEKFLNMVADLIGKQNQKIQDLQSNQQWNELNCPFVDRCMRVD